MTSNQIPGAAEHRSPCLVQRKIKPTGLAMDGRAPCGFLVSFGGGGGIIGSVGERGGEREHHGERMEIFPVALLAYEFNDKPGEDGIYWL